MRTKLFFDCEFTGLHQKTTLVSIGIVSECGKRFYAELVDYDTSQVDEWLQKNVINKLTLNDMISNTFLETDNLIQFRGDKRMLGEYLKVWFTEFEEIEMWSDCLSYDWVLFNDIFGHAFNIPKNIYYIPMDLCTLFLAKGIDPDINREGYAGLVSGKDKHHALWDAEIIKDCYNKTIRKKNKV